MDETRSRVEEIFQEGPSPGSPGDKLRSALVVECGQGCSLPQCSLFPAQGSRFPRCSTCLRAKYCGREHQVADFDRHRRFCSAIPLLTALAAIGRARYSDPKATLLVHRDDRGRPEDANTLRRDCFTEMELDKFHAREAMYTLASGLRDPASSLGRMAKDYLFDPQVLSLVRDFVLERNVALFYGKRRKGMNTLGAHFWYRPPATS